jgi:hypothetical protein
MINAHQTNIRTELVNDFELQNKDAIKKNRFKKKYDKFRTSRDEG